MLFKPGQCPAHRRSGKLQLLCRSCQSARLRDHYKHSDSVEVELIHEQGFISVLAQGSNQTASHKLSHACENGYAIELQSTIALR